MSLVMHKHCISSHLQHFFPIRFFITVYPRGMYSWQLILCALTTAHMATSRGQTVTDKAT